MKIRNKNNKERDVEILLEINKDNNKYIIYKDYITDNIYAGKLNDNKLVLLDKEEYIYLNKMMERMEG